MKEYHRNLARRPFDLTNKQDDQELKTWCSLYWQDTFYRAIKNRNAPTYHDCCFSFSRRGFVKKISHPKLTSASLLQIPSLRSLESPADLHRWLRERLYLHYQLGKKTYFPTINIAHTDIEEEEEDRNKASEDVPLLEKRGLELSVEIEQLENSIARLKVENKRLLSSSRVWYDKYLDLLPKEEICLKSFEVTPAKMNRATEIDVDNLIV